MRVVGLLNCSRTRKSPDARKDELLRDVLVGGSSNFAQGMQMQLQSEPSLPSKLCCWYKVPTPFFCWSFKNDVLVTLSFTMGPKSMKNLHFRLCKSYCRQLNLSKVEKTYENRLDLIPSPSSSMKSQIIGGKVCLRCKHKTILGVVNKLLKTKKFVDITQ